jgi:NAD(P)-dependent dehydrogenase (short-subunit alcohol dehydrogenase family)
MDFGLKNRLALVTASGRGIGRAIAQCLAREGTHVAVVSRTQKDIDSLLLELGGEKQGHFGVSLDLCEDGGPSKLVEKLKENFGMPSIVVHNIGGTLNIKDPFCSLEDWRKVYRHNFEVTVELNGMLVPKMREDKWGRVVHISSISAMENHGPVTYCSMKAALTAYTRSLGGVVAPDGVVISAVLPGAVFTDGGYWDVTSRDNPDLVHKFLNERQRIGRFGETEEIGNYVTFLCSDRASFNTGSIVPVDGGQGRGYFGQ